MCARVSPAPSLLAQEPGTLSAPLLLAGPSLNCQPRSDRGVFPVGIPDPSGRKAGFSPLPTSSSPGPGPSEAPQLSGPTMAEKAPRKRSPSRGRLRRSLCQPLALTSGSRQDPLPLWQVGEAGTPCVTRPRWNPLLLASSPVAAPNLWSRKLALP